MDNFEWIFGGAAKFGLYECNIQTQERTARKSVWLYSQISMKKELTREMIDEFEAGPSPTP